MDKQINNVYVYISWNIYMHKYIYNEIIPSRRIWRVRPTTLQASRGLLRIVIIMMTMWPTRKYANMPSYVLAFYTIFLANARILNEEEKKTEKQKSKIITKREKKNTKKNIVGGSKILCVFAWLLNVSLNDSYKSIILYCRFWYRVEFN